MIHVVVDTSLRTLDGGSEKASNWNVFMRLSCNGRPCNDLVNALSSSAGTWPTGSGETIASPGVMGLRGSISSTAEENRTPGPSSLGFVSVAGASADACEGS